MIEFFGHHVVHKAAWYQRTKTIQPSIQPKNWVNSWLCLAEAARLFSKSGPWLLSLQERWTGMNSKCCSFFDGIIFRERTHFFFFTVVLKIFPFLSGFPCHFNAVSYSNKRNMAFSTSSQSFPLQKIDFAPHFYSLDLILVRAMSAVVFILRYKQERLKPYRLYQSRAISSVMSVTGLWRQRLRGLSEQPQMLVTTPAPSEEMALDSPVLTRNLFIFIWLWIEHAGDPSKLT